MKFETESREFEKFLRSLEQFFLGVGQNNFGNKIPFSFVKLFFQDSQCGVCDHEKATTMVQMFGQPYHQNTLKPVAPSEQASMNRVCIL